MLALLSLVLLHASTFRPLSSTTPVAQHALPGTEYRREEVSIPMRDGVKLFAIVLRPSHSDRSLPIIFIRTPFSAAGIFRTDQVPLAYRELAEDGYIFVLQDIRGRFRSEGEFVSLRAQADPRSPAGINESTDSWDSIDWLIRHLPRNNGRVGVLGMSYPGWLAALAGVNPHPSVRAISPQAPVADAWMGDDFFHQGAFRQTQAAVYSGVIEADLQGFSELPHQGDDQYAFYLRFPTLDSLARSMDVTNLPTWKAAVEHPTYDDYWQSRALPSVLRRATVPTLIVGGWWDAEDILGPQLLYRTLERSDRLGLNRLVMGPWTHGGWMRSAGDSVGPLSLGSRTAEFFRQEIQRPWFAFYLYDRGPAPETEVWAFETGSNRWRTFDAWPPRTSRPRKVYLGAGGRLSFEPPPATPASTDAYDAFVSDPARPVPFAPRPYTDDGWAGWLLNDQRFVDKRPDVASWRSEPLGEDLVVAGDVVAHLTASTSGTDADWVVKLIDLFPDSIPEAPSLSGYQLMINADIMRGRYWKGFSVSTAIAANTPTRFTIDLHQQLYRIRKGHRLMVQVQSSWFPLYDRNPQTFVPNIFRARATDYRAREHRIWHTPRQPSYLVLPILPGEAQAGMGRE